MFSNPTRRRIEIAGLRGCQTRRSRVCHWTRFEYPDYLWHREPNTSPFFATAVTAILERSYRQVLVGNAIDIRGLLRRVVCRALSLEVN
jgi:hypothetical protein